MDAVTMRMATIKERAYINVRLHLIGRSALRACFVFISFDSSVNMYLTMRICWAATSTAHPFFLAHSYLLAPQMAAHT
jgi:hypothetical protein